MMFYRFYIKGGKRPHFSFLKMDPTVVLRTPKQIGQFQLESTKPFQTLPLTIKEKPIVVKIKGRCYNEGIWVVDQYEKLKLFLDVGGDGAIQALSSNLQQTLKQVLEEEALPDWVLVTRGFLNTTRAASPKAYLTWAKDYDKYLPVKISGLGDYDEFEILPEKLADNSDEKVTKLTEELKKFNEISVEAELYCWARKDEEKNTLQVGITPRLKAIRF
jgi:hypothetical protein